MADKPEKSDLDAVLSRLERDWRELAQLVQGSAPASAPVLEAEKFLLKDEAGRARGEWYLTAEGGAALVLSDPQGRSRAQLGLNDRGGAYLTLRDEFGAIIFQAPDGPRTPRAPAEAQRAQPAPDPALASRLDQVALDLADLRQLVRGQEQAPPEASPAASLPLPANLARLERQGRRGQWFGATALALALLTLAGLGLSFNRVQWRGAAVEAPAFVLKGPEGPPLAHLNAPEGRPRLDLLDASGKVQATLGLQQGGTPGLTLYDQEHRTRAELALGPQGEPTLGLRDEAGVLRTALGNVGPQNLGPPSTLVRPTASLAFFDDRGRPIWLIPWRPRP